MQAILLAAGYGHRMRPLTDERHKTLLTIGGQTIIARILDGLWQNGVTDVAIVTGYRADELRAHVLTHHPEFGFTFVHNPRYRETNNIHSLALALQQLPIDDDVILVETDLVCAPEVFARIIHTRHANAALLDRWRLGMDGTVVTIEGGLVHQVIPPNLQVGDFSFRDKFKTVNVYKFSKEFCRTQFRQLLTFYAQTFDDNCYYELILGILIYMGQAEIHAEVIDGLPWSEVDDPNDLRIAEFVFDKPARRRILDESMGGYWSHEITDFRFIRNMYFPTGAVLSELRANLPRLLQNYGSSQAMLDQKLANVLLVDVHRLHVLNGASQLYPFLGQCWGQKKALLPSPTFGEYSRWFSRHTTYRDAPGFDPVEIDVRAEDAELVVFVNPNNPVGSILPTQWIFDFARRHARKQILVDESFLEFSNQPSILTLLEKTPLANVLVIKSLSKSLGMPGVRLGWSYTRDPALQAQIGEALPIWNLNSIAEYLLEILPKHRRSMDESFVQTMADRESFAAALRALRCVERVAPSAANFLRVTMRKACVPEGGWVSSLLASHDIFVKDVSDRCDDSGVHLRLAVRLPSENLALCQAMAATALSR